MRRQRIKQLGSRAAVSWFGRHGADIEGLRLDNLCAQGAYSGVYWNDGSFQEFSYVTGADSAEMGQGGMRVNMVPRDGGNSFHGQVLGNYSPSAWGSDNCNSPGVGQACTSANLVGDTTFNKTGLPLPTSRSLRRTSDNPGVGGPIMRKGLVHATFIPRQQAVADSF
jgi:hypothetical protein